MPRPANMAIALSHTRRVAPVGHAGCAWRWEENLRSGSRGAASSSSSAPHAAVASHHRSLANTASAAVGATVASAGSSRARRLRRSRHLYGGPFARSVVTAAVSAGSELERDGVATSLRLPEKFRFSADDPSDSFLTCLEEHGVVVLEGALLADEVADIKDLIWDWLQGLGVDRNNLETWRIEGGRWPQDNTSEGGSTGVVATCGASQTMAAWRVRAAPRVRRAFERLWNTTDLLTSMDALILWRPWRQKPPTIPETWRTCSAWLHLDQNIVKEPSKLLVQGLVALTPADAESTGGFVLVPGGHRKDAQDRLRTRLIADGELAGRKLAKKRGDFMVMPADDDVYCQSVVVPLKPGDLVLWDSRVPHASEPAQGLEDQRAARFSVKPSESLLRMAVPVCMAPRSMAEDLPGFVQWRQEAVAKGIATKHWPHKMRPQGSPAGDGYKPPVLTDVMRRLL
mmetsp:Transcript_3249/g.9925  ORF Transcript_3249/g.9925 Transcript_3249/m.9925 type:complete len:456 (+) Transcript_3249:32-1399(+)